MKFKICYTVDAPYAGGAERYISLIIRALDKRFFEPVVLVKRGPHLEAWREDLLARGVEVEETEMELPFILHHAFGIYNTLRRIAPDIVHVNMPGPYDGQMGLLAPIARFAGASRVVVTEHLPMVEKLWKRAFVKEISYHWVDKVLTVCRTNISYLVERQRVPPGKIAVVHNALPPNFGNRRGTDRGEMRERLGISGGRTTDPSDGTTAIVMVGSLIERKGLPVLLKALVPLTGLSWKLFVVGEGEKRAEYERLAAQLGIEYRVRFLGSVPEDEVERILGAVDLLVLPSFMEAMPYVILEAMACGLPVIASRIHGIPEMVKDGETAFLVPPGDIDRLSSRIGELITNPHVGRQMGENGRERFEAFFTINKQIEAIQAIYLELMGCRTAIKGTPFGKESTS